MLKLSTSILAALALSFASFTVTGCGAADDAAPGDEQDVTSSNARFETFKGADGKYYFHLIAGNGEKIIQSQAYTTLAGAKKGIESVKSNGLDLANYDLNDAADGEAYFNIVAQNHEIIATSEMYVSMSNASRGVDTAAALVAKVSRQDSAPQASAHFELFKGIDGQRYFHIRSTNGEVVLQSEGYASTTGAKNGVASVHTNGGMASNYEILAAENGQYYFRLKAKNGEVIAFGETYSSKSNATAAVKRISDMIWAGQVADPQ